MSYVFYDDLYNTCSPIDMKIIKLTVLFGLPKTLAIPLNHHVKIYKTSQLFCFQILPNNKDDLKILCPEGMDIYIDKKFIPDNQPNWIKIINENEVPLDIIVEFYCP